MINLIKFYRKYLSRLKIRPACIFYPTWSQYAIRVIEKYGTFKGLQLSIKRIISCNPWTYWKAIKDGRYYVSNKR